MASVHPWMPDRVTVQVPRPVGVSRTPGEDAGKNFAHGAENVADAQGTRYGRFQPRLLTPQELIHKRTLFLLPSKDPFSAVLTGEAKQVR